MCRNQETRIFVQSGKIYGEQLRKIANNLKDDQARLEKELEDLAVERQCVITLVRRHSITATDMEYQLSALTMQEISLKHELLLWSKQSASMF